MILLTYGTRPEYIKIKPLIDVFNKYNYQYRVLFTGQHKDLLKSTVVDYRVDILEGTNRLDSIIESVMNVEYIWNNITHVLVQGDTTSVLAVALAAFHRNIKVIHLEAGLRTYDNQNPYPEEQNRRLVSQITDIHLCPTELSMQNLINEKILGDKYVVGNTVLDNLLSWKEKVNPSSNSVLITMHRRENHFWMNEWFEEINKIAKKYDYLTFIFPVHPNPNVQRHKDLIDAPNVKLIEPVSHDKLLEILVNSRLVITDSGGIQEECSFFNKICLTCRKITERPEAIGQSTVMVKSPQELSKLFDKYVIDFYINYECPFGDGKSAEKIYEILKKIK